MKRAGCVRSARLAKKRKTQDDKNDRSKDQSKLPQLTPVLLQKIASMLSDGGKGLQLRDRIRFSSVSRQMNTAVRSSIDGMQRRRMDVCVAATRVRIDDVFVRNQPSTGYTQTERIDALLAFSRPNEIKMYCPDAQGDRLLVAKRILKSILPNSILRLGLDVSIEEFEAGTPFYGMLTAVGKMINLERLTMDCKFKGNHVNSSSSLPPGSPFLQLLKLEKLRALHVIGYDSVLTATQHADLINRSSSNIRNICFLGSDFSQLMASLNDRSRSHIINLCCLHVDEVLQLTADQLHSLVDCLPQCTTVSVPLSEGFPYRWVIDQMGGRLLESAISLGHKKKLTVYVESDYLDGQTFNYERESTIVQMKLVSISPCSHYFQ